MRHPVQLRLHEHMSLNELPKQASDDNDSILGGASSNRIKTKANAPRALSSTYYLSKGSRRQSAKRVVAINLNEGT